MVMKAASLIYRHCPVWVQNLAISLYGLIIYFQRYGKTYRRYLLIYSSRDYSSEVRNKRMQNREFMKLLHYAVRNSEFYREFYKEIDLSDIKSVEDIGKLPILTKETFKKNIDRIYTIPSSNKIIQDELANQFTCHKQREVASPFSYVEQRKVVKPFSYVKLYTGGTTGIPIRILVRKRDLQKRLAYLDAYKLEYGFQANKMRCARFIGKNIVMNTPDNHIYWRDNYISKQRYYSTYHLVGDNMSYYVNNLNTYRPEAIDGFVSAIYTLAKYIDDNQLTLSFIPKAVFTTSETVLPMHREMIEKVFRCPLSDQYASNDGAPFIKQCRYGAYHENLDTGVFEHIRTSQGVKLVVTGFHTYGTPLIRYDIGDDILESEQKTCPCGSCHPIIAGIAGRTTDYLWTKTRGKISQAALSSLVAELPDCFEQLQFLQENHQLIHVKVVMKEAVRLEEYQSLLEEKLIRYLGNDMELRIERVASIDREKSGKLRLIKT